MTLEQWMAANGFDDSKVAELTDLHRTFVWKLRKGLRKPGPEVMDTLVRVSHGAITRPALRPDLYPEAAE
jgi:DNA-binding transcriptional regulator YdaS (Cro superfamily)